MKHLKRVSVRRPATAQDWNFDNLDWTSFFTCLVSGKDPLQCILSLFTGLFV